MGTPSMTHQVLMLADKHDGRGMKKHVRKRIAQKRLLPITKLTREHIFSTKTRSGFLKVAGRFARDMRKLYGCRLLRDIRPKYFDHWFNTRCDEWAPQTQANYFDHISRLNLYMKERGWGNGFILRRPERMIQNYKSNVYRGDRARAWTHDEFAQLLSNIPDEYHSFLIVAQETGMRAVEIQRLTWDQVDLGTGEITVSGKGGRERKIQITKTCTDVFLQLEHVPYKPFENIKVASLRKAIYRSNKRHTLPSRNLHAVRHLWSEDEFIRAYDDAIDKGESRQTAVRKARRAMSKGLGHGRVGGDGRLSVSYSYLTANRAKELTNEPSPTLDT